MYFLSSVPLVSVHDPSESIQHYKQYYCFYCILIILINVRLFFQKLKSKNTKIKPPVHSHIVHLTHTPFNPKLSQTMNHDRWTLHRQQGGTCLNTAPGHNQDIWIHSRELLTQCTSSFGENSLSIKCIISSCQMKHSIAVKGTRWRWACSSWNVFEDKEMNLK